ncbi:helix-turn-helix transcriptional regulator [Serratia oryzae]|uniref:helix-turn-helix transcriptional regulator n=1 Tax=Serratia oryzae TaxID=2034155 RepID=UPI0009FA79CD|nr:LuxR family transcriptional regulator [Serratia oryzae]
MNMNSRIQLSLPKGGRFYVTVLSNDYFFSLGLISIVKEYFSKTMAMYQSYSRTLSFCSESLMGCDIVFREHNYPWVCSRCYRRPTSDAEYISGPVRHINIRERNMFRGNMKFSIGCDASVDEVYHLLGSLLSIFSKERAQSSMSQKQRCERCRLLLLTPAERRVLNLFMTGLSLTSIAIKLQLSPKTISALKGSAMRRLEVNNKVELYNILSRYDYFFTKKLIR